MTYIYIYIPLFVCRCSLLASPTLLLALVFIFDLKKLEVGSSNNETGTRYSFPPSKHQQLANNIQSLTAALPWNCSSLAAIKSFQNEQLDDHHRIITSAMASLEEHVTSASEGRLRLIETPDRGRCLESLVDLPEGHRWRDTAVIPHGSSFGNLALGCSRHSEQLQWSCQPLSEND